MLFTDLRYHHFTPENQSKDLQDKIDKWINDEEKTSDVKIVPAISLNVVSKEGYSCKFWYESIKRHPSRK